MIENRIREYGDKLIEKYNEYEKSKKIKKKDYSDFHQFMTKFDNYYVEDPLFDDFIDIKFMKNQEKLVDCMLMDCCKEYKEYLKNL